MFPRAAVPRLGALSVCQVAVDSWQLRVAERPLAHVLVDVSEVSSRGGNRVAGRPIIADAAGVLRLPPATAGVALLDVHAINPVGRVVTRTDRRGAWRLPQRTAQATCTQRIDGSWQVVADSDNADSAFHVLAGLWDAYCVALRPLLPPSARPFPLPPPIMFPDHSPAALAWVQPVSWPNGQPRMRLPATDPAGNPMDFSSMAGVGLLAHELAHLVHFAGCSVRQRAVIGAQYLMWLAGAAVTTGSPFHHPTARTSSTVAWVEAFGLLAERFAWYAQLAAAGEPSSSSRTGQRDPDELARSFVADELSGHPTLADHMPGYVQVADMNAGTISHLCEDTVVEGGIYSRTFLEVARKSSLAAAVQAYLRQATPPA